MDGLILENLKGETETVSFSGDLDYLNVEQSPIQGLGLFTCKSVPAYKILFKIRGKKVHRVYDPAFAQCDPNWLGTGYQEWLEIEEGDLSIFINHSCSPNVIVDRHLQVVTLRPIEENEELLMDYSTTELDPYWSMKCGCGCLDCRRILLSFQYLPLELKREYGRFLAPALTNAI